MRERCDIPCTSMGDASTVNSAVDAWKPDREIAKWARREGFGEARPMTSAELRTLAKDHDGHPRGLYMFECANHEVYVGISGANVASRLRAHLKNFDAFDPREFRFQEFDGSRTEYRQRERELIWSSVWAEFTSLNREHGSGIVGASAFDEVISVPRQERWLGNSGSVNSKERSPICERTSSQFARAQPQFQRFTARSDAEKVIGAIATYLALCVPFPRSTETTHWALTCLSSVRLQGNWKRIATLSMAYVETLWISESPDGAEMEVCIGTDLRELPKWNTEARLRKNGATMCGIGHQSGGIYEEVLLFNSPEKLAAALEASAEIRAAAARFALDRMRKSAVSGRYAEAHNHVFAERALKLARRRS